MVGSQCRAMPDLTFLPELASELHDVLVDPQRGACEPALPDGGLLCDPSRDELLSALDGRTRRPTRRAPPWYSP